MTTRGGWTLAAALCAVALSFLTDPRAEAQTTAKQQITVKWHSLPLVNITLTPNYVAGFGQVPAVIGVQPTPTHGPGAVLGGGTVDFGDVLAGSNYLYKYAVHINVASSDPNGVNVYGEGAAQFTGPSSYPINSTIYYLTSTSGAPPDPNTGFSASVPFQPTVGAPSAGCATQAGPCSIVYGSYPTPISQSSTANSDFYYDYQLHVPGAASSGDYYTWIVYTVIGK
ncbi:MAG: hypothetical protein JO160_05040 [Candidatus Eremiobacteraeota bacterium]|nr:hypothetical protein [Candidatus Eremiobacteraeota bacterium]